MLGSFGSKYYMCGFVGSYHIAASPGALDEVVRAAQLIEHRGPDSSGSFSDSRIAFAFRRLSIIDLKGGDQPLFNENRAKVLVANGEIYNFRELRKHLTAKGHFFHSRSDCETILHLYEQEGIEGISRLNGMFAFALYDSNTATLILARDRLGIKPLYYAELSDSFLFASEIKPLLAMRPREFPLEQHRIPEYFAFRNLSGHDTFFHGIREVPPGHLAIITNDRLRIKKYWSPDTRQATDEAAFSSTFTQAVDRQLVSEVPLGTQLSGGVDSSLVSACAASLLPEISAFNVALPIPKYDEASDAKEVAAHIGANLHTVDVYARDFHKTLEESTWHCEEPLAHANSVAILLLCRFAREHVKVLLTGEGADELFGGYPRYYAAIMARTFAERRGIPKRLIIRTIGWPRSSRTRKLAEQLELATDEQIAIWNSAFVSRKKLKDLLGSIKGATGERAQVWAATAERGQQDFLSRLLTYDIETYLPAILCRQDKMSMAASLEARVPFLDNELIDYAFRLPAHVKIKRLTTKFVVKHHAANVLPKKVVYKRKQGFGIPISEWLRQQQPLTAMLDVIGDDPNALEFVPKSVLYKLISEHRTGTADHSDVLWPMLAYITWKNVFRDFIREREFKQRTHCA